MFLLQLDRQGESFFITVIKKCLNCIVATANRDQKQ